MGNLCLHQKKKLPELTCTLPNSTITEVALEKKPGEKRDRVGVSVHEIGELIRLDFERYLPHYFEDVLNNGGTAPPSPDLPLFSYLTKSFPNGIYIMFGTDHGQGYSQFLLRMNLFHSQTCRDKQRADYGTRTLSFATIQCKKDPYEVLKLTMPATQYRIHLLNSNMLIAVVNEDRTKVQTFFVRKKV